MDLFTPQPDFQVHQFEKGEGNQAILNNCKSHLTKQMRITFDVLMSGRRITALDLAKEFNITDGRRRLKELLDNGVEISKELEGRTKLWYMNPEQIKANKSYQIV